LAVAGAGLAGLQAAIEAARWGAKVTLFEQQVQIGGMWRLYSQGQPRLQALLDYFQHMIEALQIELHLNYEFTKAEAPDYEAVIVAVGALPAAATVPQAPELPLLSAGQYLQNPQHVERALVWDTLGDWQAQVVCRSLAAQNAQIRLVSPDVYLAAQDVKNGTFSYWYQELASLPLTAHQQSEITWASGQEVVLRDRYSGREEVLGGVDLLIAASADKDNLALYEQLLGTNKVIRAVGDCLAPRSLMVAMREGYLAAREVCSL